MMLQTNADASLLSGNFGMDTLRQSIFGANQGRSLLDVTTKVGTSQKDICLACCQPCRQGYIREAQL